MLKPITYKTICLGLITVFFLVILGCGSKLPNPTNSSNTDQSSSLSTSENSGNINRQIDTYNGSGVRPAKEIDGYEWNTLTNVQKKECVSNIIRSWKNSGKQVVKDSTWFISGLDAFYNGTETKSTKLPEAISMLAVTGGAGSNPAGRAIESQVPHFKMWEICCSRQYSG